MSTITEQQQQAIAARLEGVEAWFDRLWVLFGRPYYERWEDA